MRKKEKANYDMAQQSLANPQEFWRTYAHQSCLQMNQNDLAYLPPL